MENTQPYRINMDLFNKKKIKRLESEIQKLWYNLAEKEKQIRKLEEPRCFEVGNSLPEDSILLYFGKRQKAITDYLGIDFTWIWEDDPNYYSMPKVSTAPQVRVCRAVKLVKTEKTKQKTI